MQTVANFRFSLLLCAPAAVVFSIFSPPGALGATKEVVELNNAGITALKECNYALAIERLEQAFHGDNSYSSARINLCIAYNNFALSLMKTDLPRAIHLLYKAAYLDESNVVTLKTLNCLLKGQGKNIADSTVRLEMAKQAQASGQIEAAVVEYREALRLKDDPEVRKQFESLPQLPAIKAQYKENPAYVEMCKALSLAAQNNIKEADKAFETAERLAGNDREFLAELYSRQGMLSLDQNNLASAKYYLDKALAAQNDHPLLRAAKRKYQAKASELNKELVNESK